MEIKVKEITLGHCFGKPRMVFEALRYLIPKKPRSESRDDTAAAIKCSYVLQSSTRATRLRRAEPRRSVLVLASRDAETSDRTWSRPRLGKLDRCI